MPTTDAQATALGKLLLIQNALEVLPNETSIASFLCRSLSTIPGVKDVHVCIRGVLTPDDARYRDLCRACGENGSSLATPPPIKLFPLRTSQQVYGALFLSIDDADQLSFCQPYLANTANTVATLLESRDYVHQLHLANEQIQRGRDELEVRVQQRTADLLRANEELQREMSERKQAEESQRIGQIGSWYLGLNSQLLTWSDELYRIYGVSPDTFVPNLESFFNLILPEDQPAMKTWLTACVTGEHPGELVFRTILPDGTVNFISGYGKLICNAENRPISLSGTGHNITEHKQMEQALISSREEAERANNAKDSFLATMSHEIRTPLGAMLGMLELLSMTHLEAEQITTLDTARSSGQDLLRILNDILDWSKIEEGKLQITPTPAVIEAMLQEVVNTYSNIASAKSIIMWKHIDSRLATSYWLDQMRLSQVLNNFVSNAIKFTEFGEIEIRAELLESLTGGDLIRISVKDSGIGISKQEQENLFQNYSQGNTDTARMYGGTGLGLAICRRLAEMQGGEITLVSEPGLGSTFSIILTLPRADSVAEMAVPRQSDMAKRAIQKLFISGMDAPLVLVVDDHPTNRELLSRQIKLLGLRATKAENGRVGLELWRDGRFALVITDCHMPDMDGYEMTRAIRKIEAIEGRPRTPVIAWTANALKEEQERIEAAGMDELLVKPVSLHMLRTMLAKWLKPNGDDGKDADVEMSSPDLNPTAHTSSPIDYSVLDAIMGNKTEQPQLLRDFLDHIRSDRRKLDELLAQDDHAATQTAVHRMEGSCRMVGAVRLGNACTTIEQADRTGDTITVRVTVAELDEALHEMEKFVGQLTSPIPPTG